ncbi:hypothetical protein HWV62_35374 [Athelia sp. TMB]|nr:hypothetical protein HWV62_35374 [Athelia sp. TMB]
MTTVDDADPRIQYSGDWVTSGSIEGEQTYDGTLHGTSTIGAEITFSFTGTSVYVYGTVAPTTVPAVTNYTIDGGVPFTFVAPIVDFAAGDFCFYQSPNLVDGVHTLVITNNANDVAYWFDYLTYKVRRRPPALPTSIIFPTDSHFSASARDPSLPIVFDDDLAPSEGDYRQVERHGSKATLAAGVPRRDNDVYSEHTSWIGSHYPASEYRAVPT